MNGGLQLLTAAARVAGAHVDRHLHGAGIGAHHAGIDLNEVADVNRAVKANAAGIHRNGVFTRPLHRAGRACLIDPLHGGAAVDIAAPVDVCGLGKEAVDHARRIRGAVIGLLFHLFLDGLAQLNAGLRSLPHALVLGGLRGQWRHGNCLSGFSVLGHEDDETVAGTREDTVARIG